jgi:superfamily I DNA/RNA helicase/mRNA-degrading endonuclease RelE of RelBE toxin-antitoxin system
LTADISSEIKVAISDKFIIALTQLPKSQQRKTMEFVSAFRQNPKSPGLNYEKVRKSADPQYRSARIDKSYRAIVRAPNDGNVYLLLWVDKHDDAYDWARAHRCEVHPSTGTLQIFEATVAVESVGEAEIAKPATHMNMNSENRPNTPPTLISTEPMFDLTQEQFIEIGVPPDLLDAVSNLSSEEALERLESRLPQEAFEALYLIAAGTAWEEVRADYGTRSEEPVNVEDIEKALDRPSTQRGFWVIDGDAELQKVLDAPLERWRVFLHPTQRSLVSRNWNGPVRVLGGAGTGKTVVAMHRAAWLARNVLAEKEKVLVTTFTANLATDIEQNLRKLCSTEEMERIEVQHIDGWVSDFLRKQNYQHTIVYEGTSQRYQQMWKQSLAARPSEPALSESFYREEWERVILTQRVLTRDDYFRASRTGRGIALNRRQRAAIWPVFEELRFQMNREGLRTFEDATLDALELIDERGSPELPYRSVIVDEAQDMGPQALRLLRKITREQMDDMFLVGDGHQRIYRRFAVLGQCGIRIIGRGRKLRINYRTTEQTRRFACSILRGLAIDDLDGSSDTHVDYRSLTHGSPPKLKGFVTAQDERAAVIEMLQELIASGVAGKDICVAARTNRIIETFETAIAGAGLHTELLRNRGDRREIPGVRLGTMHRVKGLEFRYMFLVDVSQNTVPPAMAISSSDDPVEQRQIELNERALLHVAATRAALGLFVTWHGLPSSYMSV